MGHPNRWEGQMLPFRARRLRTALFTTALLTAVSLPATGAQAAQGAGDQHGIKRSHPAGTAQHYDRFPLVTGGSGGNASAIGGVVSWTRNRFVYGGRVTDVGRGTSQLTLRLTGLRGSRVKFFTADDTEVRTDFRTVGRYERLRVTLCWQLEADKQCATRSISRR
jgi:hypothetical protein